MHSTLNKILLSCWLTDLTSAIGFVLWQSEWEYNLPTPVPAKYKPIPNDTYIDCTLPADLKKGKPVLLHFFNPACPFSRFNMMYFKTLVKKYNDKVSFALVLVSAEDRWKEKASHPGIAGFYNCRPLWSLFHATSGHYRQRSQTFLHG